jgi:opacity protein-like surface antigen
MNLVKAGRRIVGSAVVVSVMLAAPVWAQEGGQSEVERMQSMQNEPTDPSYNAPYTWNFSVGAGTASGANPVGSFIDEEAESVSTFEIDSGVLVSGRVARRLWWRLGVEGEFGYASPGVLLTETDLQGANVQTEPFGDFTFAYVGISARVDLVDARVTPFLLGGFAMTFNEYPEGDNSSEPGFLFGGGLDVRLIENIYLRGDVKGLRANVDAPNLTRGILEQFEEDRTALSTQVLWTVGFAVRF